MDATPSRAKEQILEAATRLMEVHGYHRTALGDVLRESGTGKGNFYYYFHSKEALGYAILDRIIRDFTTRLLDPILSDPGRRPLDQIYDFLDALVAAQRARRCVGGCPFGNLAVELADAHEGFRQRLTAAFDRWRTYLTAALERARAEGALEPCADPDRLARFLVAGIEGAILLSKVQKDITVLEECVAELKHHLTVCVAGPAAPRTAVRGQ
jgi:TetR/AcrR family transcriptional regulator, transcriptional repressor for nem operon